MRKRVPLKFLIILIVVLATIMSLGITGILLQHTIAVNEQKTINLRLRSSAQMAATDVTTIRALQNKADIASDSNIQKKSQQVAKINHLDFVVILNDQLIRLSHPDKQQIGKVFSSPKDASRALKGKQYFSTKKGILGMGYRYFSPIYDQHHNIIGVVVVGLTEDTITNSINTAEKPIIFGLILGCLLGIIGSLILAKYIKLILLNMEPYDIAEKLMEKNIIEDSMVEGLLAISDDYKIISKNTKAASLLPSIGSVNDVIDQEVYDSFFNDRLPDKQPKRTTFLGREFVYSTAKISKNNLGTVMLFRDVTDFRDLVSELDGTRQYAQALRAQTHEFRNELQTILGLVELEKYDEISKLIPQLSKEYNDNIGYVTSRIKAPVISGFLIGKIKFAKEKNITVIIDSESYFPDENMEGIEITNIIKIIGNLLDNAIEAVTKSENPIVKLLLKFNKKNGRVSITVTDNGYGVDDEIKNNIFNIGFSTKSGNRGYGLATIDEIVAMHNGSLSVKCSEGRETVFMISYIISNHLTERNENGL